MKILSPIEFLFNARIQLIKTFSKGNKDINEIKLTTLKNDIDKLEIKDNIQDLEIKLRHKKKLRKTKLLTFFSFFGFFTSVCLTLAGTEKIDFFDIDTLNTANITYIAIIGFLQSIVFIATSRESVIKERYYNHYWGFKIAQYLIVASSIYYNFRFFMMYFKEMSILEIIITALICAGLDIVTIKLIALKNDMKNNVQSFRNFKDIKVKEEKDKDIKEEKVKDIVNDIKDKDIIQVKDISKDKVKDVKDIKEEKVKDNTKENLKDKAKDNLNTSKKNHKVFDMRFIEIAKYITDEFSDGELISWTKIKDLFEIKDEYNLKKLRKYLKDKDIIMTKGKKSYKNNLNKVKDIINPKS
ncbi:MAG: hypothetical protein ABF289_18100 [Clostridiales bacterium]